MTTYLALLRGINVSGKNSIRMPALQESLADMGFKDVRTYLQSGNVVFRDKPADKAKLAAAIEARITRDFGHKVPVRVVSESDLDAIAGSNPLWPEGGGDEKLFHCTFLFEEVPAKSFEALKLPAAEGEQAVLMKGAVLLHCPHGYGRTKLNNTYFERALKVQATTRNWRSVLALRDLCKEPRP